MKAEIINIIILLIWCIIGHFFPSIVLLFNFIIYPIVFILSETLLKYRLESYPLISFIFILIFINDFLFRLYGGGIHDEVGKALVEISFHLTLLSTIVSMLIIIGIRGNLVRINAIKYIAYIIVWVITTLVIYNNLYETRIWYIPDW